MMIKRLIILTYIVLTIISCEDFGLKNSNSEPIISTSCNIDSLKKWSKEIVDKKRSVFYFSDNVVVKFSDDSTSVTVNWEYNVENPKKMKDELVEYITELVKEKISLPKNFILRFDYRINAYCPAVSELPIEVNTEIKNLILIDVASFSEYHFDVIRGRIDSGLKITGNIKYDTVNLKFQKE